MNPTSELLAAIANRPTWMARAACRGLTSLMFPERGETGGTEARQVCASCSVIAECAEAAVGERYGIWAGDSADAQMRARRRARRALESQPNQERQVS